MQSEFQKWDGEVEMFTINIQDICVDGVLASLFLTLSQVRVIKENKNSAEKYIYRNGLVATLWGIFWTTDFEDWCGKAQLTVGRADVKCMWKQANKAMKRNLLRGALPSLLLQFFPWVTSLFPDDAL